LRRFVRKRRRDRLRIDDELSQRNDGCELVVFRTLSARAR